MPRKSKNSLSFSSAFLYFFYLGGSIWITLIFRIYSMFTDLLARRSSWISLFSRSPAGILLDGPTLRLLIGTFGIDGWSFEFIDRSNVFSSFFSYFSFQLFFLPGEGDVILPRLLLLSFLSWLSDLFTLISCSASTFFLEINSLKDSVFLRSLSSLVRRGKFSIFMLRCAG